MANDALIGLAIQKLPEIISAFKGMFGRHNPTAPEPTDAEAVAALETALKSSIAKDEAWLAAHPE